MREICCIKKTKDFMKRALVLFLCAAAMAAFVSDGKAESDNQQVAESSAIYIAAQAQQAELQIQTQSIEALFQLSKSQKSNANNLYPTLNVFTSNKKYSFNMFSKDVKENFQSDICSYEVIGRSVRGRDIYALRVGTGQMKVLITAGVHARETANTPMVMQGLFDMLGAYQNGDSRVSEVLSRVTFIVVPLVNPDGYDECVRRNSGSKKTNARGVDLNRNFPFKYWGSKKKKKGNGYPGPHPASEPETQAIMALIAAHDFTLAVDVHSRGRLFFCQKGGLTTEDIANGRNPDELNAVSLALAQTLGNHVNYRVVPETKVVFGEEGTLTDYAFSQGIPTVTFETLKSGARQPASAKLIRQEYAFINWPNVFCEIGLFAAGQ